MLYEDEYNVPEGSSVEEVQQRLFNVLQELNLELVSGGDAPFEVADILDDETMNRYAPEVPGYLNFLRQMGLTEDYIRAFVERSLDITDILDIGDEFEEDFEYDNEEKEYNIEYIRVFYIARSREQTCECTICFMTAKNTRNQKSEKNMTVAPCGHCFHKQCITQWLRKTRNPTCPNCRREITQLNVFYHSSESLRRAKRPRFSKRMSM